MSCNKDIIEKLKQIIGDKGYVREACSYKRGFVIENIKESDAKEGDNIRLVFSDFHGDCWSADTYAVGHSSFGSTQKELLDNSKGFIFRFTLQGYTYGDESIRLLDEFQTNIINAATDAYFSLIEER